MRHLRPMESVKSYTTLTFCDNLMSVRLILYLRREGLSLHLRYCLHSVHFQLTNPVKLGIGWMDVRGSLLSVLNSIWSDGSSVGLCLLHDFLYITLKSSCCSSNWQAQAERPLKSYMTCLEVSSYFSQKLFMMTKDEVGGECSTHWRDTNFIAFQKFIWCFCRNTPPVRRPRHRENVERR